MFKSRKDLYLFLGAEKFQKLVFLLEKVKYKIIESYFPNIKNIYEKNNDRRFRKKLEKEKEENRNILLTDYQNQKLAFRKELVLKQNRNYHYNPNYPTKFIKYLEWNKKIHIRGLKKDILELLFILGITFALGNPFPIVSLLLLLKNSVSLVINFECINLQNYNLERFQKKETYALLEKMEKKKQEKNLEKLGDSIYSVSKAVTNQVELPTINQVVNEVSTIEQTRKLLEYVKEQYQNMYVTDEQRRR